LGICSSPSGYREIGAFIIFERDIPAPFVAERAKEPPRQPSPGGSKSGVYKRKAAANATGLDRQAYLGAKIITI
jgi:hypothetical protein